MSGATGERGRSFSETVKLAKEFDPNRPGVPETVAVAQAASTPQENLPSGAVPPVASRQEDSYEANQTSGDGSDLSVCGRTGCASSHGHGLSATAHQSRASGGGSQAVWGDDVTVAGVGESG